MNDEPRIEFKARDESGSLVELLRLDTKGFHYKGEFIPDAGKAHDAFLQTMESIKKANRVVIDTITIFAVGFAAGYLLCFWGLK